MYSRYIDKHVYAALLCSGLTSQVWNALALPRDGIGDGGEVRLLPLLDTRAHCLWLVFHLLLLQSSRYRNLSLSLSLLYTPHDI